MKRCQRNGRLLYVGGNANNGSICGLSASNANNGFGNANDNIGARLKFLNVFPRNTLLPGGLMAEQGKDNWRARCARASRRDTESTYAGKRKAS